MSLTATINAAINASLSGGGTELASAVASLAQSTTVSFTDGTGSGQADVIFADRRSLAASANEDLDLAGGLTDPLGASITFAKVKVIYVKADGSNANDVIVTQPASNGVPFLTAAGDGVTLSAGGLFLFYDPTGITVTASTGDLINVANGGAGSSVSYDIVIVGTSA